MGLDTYLEYQHRTIKDLEGKVIKYKRKLKKLDNYCIKLSRKKNICMNARNAYSDIHYQIKDLLEQHYDQFGLPID